MTFSGDPEVGTAVNYSKKNHSTTCH